MIATKEWVKSLLKKCFQKQEEKTGKLRFGTCTKTTDKNGCIDDIGIDSNQQLLCCWVSNISFAFATLYSAKGVMIFQGTNTSLTDDRLKHICNTSVTINYLYYED